MRSVTSWSRPWANEGVLAVPSKIKVRKYKNDPFPRIIEYVFPSKDDLDDVPF